MLSARLCSESSVQVESVVTEVLRQMLQEISSAEIKLEQERVAEEKRKLEEARLVCRLFITLHEDLVSTFRLV